MLILRYYYYLYIIYHIFNVFFISDFIVINIQYPYDIPTWQAWLVFDKKEKDWIRQSKVNTYRGDCIVTISGAWHQEINGEYGILPQTYNTRPIFERTNENNQRVSIFFQDLDNEFSAWMVSSPDAKELNKDNIWASIPSSALTVDGASDFESWQEINTPRGGNLAENVDFKITGTCSKVKEHDWKRRRRARAEERS